jgi:hypothetical protein
MYQVWKQRLVLERLERSIRATHRESRREKVKKGKLHQGKMRT